MTAEAKLEQSQISPEQKFRDAFSWVTEDILFKNRLYVIRTKNQIEDSGWHREVVKISVDAEEARSPNGTVVEVTNLFNPQGKISDSKLVVMFADRSPSRRALTLGLAFGVIEAQKTPTVTQHYEKYSLITRDWIDDFIKEVYGLRSQLLVELEDYGRFLGKIE